jgi:hypothetical protein
MNRSLGVADFTVSMALLNCVSASADSRIWICCEGTFSLLATLMISVSSRFFSFSMTRRWHRGYLFDVLAAEICIRKLKEGVPLLLERACCGDPGEMFRSLPDCLCQTAEPDWDYLLDACVRAVESPHAGARLWAVETLGMLRHEYPEKVRTVGRAAIARGASDEEKLVRDAAESWQSCLKEEGTG